MLARIIFCVVIAAAVLAVVLLATVSPLPHHRSGSGGHKGGAPGHQRTFTVYIHPAASTAVQQEQQVQERRRGASALVFHHRITAGPESTSTTVGAASGFLLPAGEQRAVASVFDTVHLAFDGGAGLSGSLCVETSNEKARRHDGEEEVLRVVGGTGAFAFARGHAVLRRQRLRPGAKAAALLLELSVSSADS